MAISSNLSATTPQDQYINSLPDPGPPTTTLDNAASLRIGYQPSGSSSTQSTPSLSPTQTPVQSARNSYLDTFQPSTALDTARQTYLNSLNPNSAVSAAKQKYLDFQNSIDQGVNQIKDKPIAAKFVTGQANTLINQNAAQGKLLQGDVSLAQQDQADAQARAKAGLDFANTDFTTAQNKAQTNLGFANEDTATAKTDQTTLDANKQFNITNNITQPFYYNGNQIINAATGKAEYQNNNGTIVRLSDNKAYSSEDPFFKDSGIKSWDQIQNKIGSAAATTKFETVTLGSGKTAQKVRYGYDAKGNIVSATDLATGKNVMNTTNNSSAPSLSLNNPASGKTSASSGTGSLTSAQVSKVNAIIKANPGEYGHAADQINKELGNGTATKADNLLKTAYMIPSDAIDIINNSGPPPTLDAWNKGLQAFINAHNYNPSVARAAYIKYVPKPSKNSSSRQP